MDEIIVMYPRRDQINYSHLRLRWRVIREPDFGVEFVASVALSISSLSGTINSQFFDFFFIDFNGALLTYLLYTIR